MMMMMIKHLLLEL